MKNLILFSLLAITPSVFSQGDIWMQKDSVKGKTRSASSAFVVDGKGFIAGGLDLQGTKRSVHAYVPFLDDWFLEAKIGGPNGGGQDRANAVAFSIGSKGYILLGSRSGGALQPSEAVFSFTPSTGTWTQEANFIGTPRNSAIAFAIGDEAFVGTGSNGSTYYRDMYKYSATTNMWQQVADFGGSARQDAVGFAMGGQGYVGTGDDGVLKSDFWQYEPTTDTWTQKASFPGAARRGAVGWGQFPQAFICTGEDNFNYYNDTWEYNFYSDTWTQRANFPGPARSQAVAFVIGSVAYVGTGYNGILYDDFFSYEKTLGIAQLNSDDVSIYPNPVTTSFNVVTDHYDLELVLMDMQGREVSGAARIEYNGNKITVHRQSLPNGTYFLQLMNENKQTLYTEKIIFV